MSNIKNTQLNTKVKALKYFHNSETRVNIMPYQVFKATKKYAQGLIEGGLAEEANQNAKVGLGSEKEGLEAIKAAKKKSDDRKEKEASIRNEKIAKDNKRKQGIIDNNNEVLKEKAEELKDKGKGKGFLGFIGLK